MVVHKQWGHLLPDVATTPKLDIVIIDDVEEGRRVKAPIPDIVKIEDDDEEEDEVEEVQLKALREPKTEQEIEERMSYLQLLSFFMHRFCFNPGASNVGVAPGEEV